MKNLIVIEELTGEIVRKKYPDCNRLKLNELQEIVDGDVEVVSLYELEAKCGFPVLMLVNEDGKFNDCGYNPVASRLYLAVSVCFDIIFGNAVICTADEEDLLPLSDEEYYRVIEVIMNKIK